MKIALAHARGPFGEAEFERVAGCLRGHDVVSWEPGSPIARDAEVLLAMGEIGRDVLESSPALGLVQTTSAGYEGVDLDAATALGIWVSNAPAAETGNAASVAEWAVLLMLAASRDLGLSLAREPAGRPALALTGKTACVIGFGGIGRELVARLGAFGVRIRVVDERPNAIPEHVEAFASRDVERAVADADYVVLCVPATPENENLVDAKLLDAMKRGVILVNVGRGTLVNEAALLGALADGRVRAAGLDVVRNEPLAADDPLARAPHAFLTPHVAGATDATIAGTAEYVAGVVERFEQGRRWPSLLNDPSKPRRRLAS